MSLNYLLSTQEINRYIQQMKLKSVAYEGQLKLKQASVLCIGAGGLGSPLLLYLAAAGIGKLGIVDHDHVERSNLNRQILYHEQHIAQKKIQAAQEQLLAANPSIQVDTYGEKINPTNAASLISSYDITADCSDNFSTRYLINDTCFKLGKPYVAASVSEFSGQCSLFLGTQAPCFRCLFPSPPQAGLFKNCDEGGVLGVLPGLLGVLQATEIIKWILQTGESLHGHVLTVELLKMEFRKFHLPANPDCETCSTHRMMPASHQREQTHSTMNHLISPQVLKNKLENHEELQLIDVRTPEKHQAFNIGGKLLPFDELPHRLHELDSTKPIVTYCTSGGRSMMALQLLLRAGFTSVQSLDGGVTAWQEKITNA